MLEIREEREGDETAIHAVTREAFAKAAHTGHNEQYIVDALRDAGALSVSLVALGPDEAVIGHLAASEVCIDDDAAGSWFGIGPVSVHPESQRRGVGSALMEAALQRLKARGAHGAVLLGDPAYYGRFGFVPASPLVLPDVPPEYFQVHSFRGAVPKGTVRYHVAFELPPGSP